MSHPSQAWRGLLEARRVPGPLCRLRGTSQGGKDRCEPPQRSPRQSTHSSGQRRVLRAVGQPGFSHPGDVVWERYVVLGVSASRACGTEWHPWAGAGGPGPGWLVPLPLSGAGAAPSSLLPSRLGCTLGCLCKPSLWLRAGLGHFSSPRTPRGCFPSAPCSKDALGSHFPPLPHSQLGLISPLQARHSASPDKQQ